MKSTQTPVQEKRLFTDDEVLEFFGGRRVFQRMEEAQLQKFLKYLEVYFKMDIQGLEANILVERDGRRVIEMDDAQVYSIMRALKHREDKLLSAEEADSRAAKEAVRSYAPYKAYLSSDKSLNNQEPIDSVLDIGCCDLGVGYNRYIESLKSKRVLRSNGYSYDFCWGADRVHGENLSGTDLNDAAALTEHLRGLADGAFDVVVSNQRLHTFTKESIGPLLEEIQRVCKKYFVIRDEEFNGRKGKIDSWILKKELLSGVLWPSALPNKIQQVAKRDPSHPLATPSGYWNTDFSLNRLIEEASDFEEVYREVQELSPSCPVIVVLKKRAFRHSRFSAPSFFNSGSSMGRGLNSTHTQDRSYARPQTNGYRQQDDSAMFIPGRNMGSQAPKVNIPRPSQPVSQSSGPRQQTSAMNSNGGGFFIPGRNMQNVRS